MAKQLEIERKFLVNFPSYWSELAEMFDELVDVKRISQTYLKPEGKEPSARVRKTVEGLTGDKETVYHFNKKVFVEDGVNEEKEHEISEKQYEKYLQKSHPDKVTIDKTRFVFKYNEQVFELDVFKSALKGLAILEIELEDKNQKVELPPYLKIVEEVTSDKRFNNFNLANKKLHEHSR
jgi:CYTH domain-containing protein